MYYVYEWFIKETNEIIYVGKGTRNRYKVKKHNALFDKLIHEHDCSSRIVKEFENEEDAFNYEYERIKELQAQCQCICNLHDGGYGGSTSWWNEKYKEWYSKNNAMKNPKQRERMSINNPMKNKEVAKIVAEKKSRKICVEDRVYPSLRKVSEEYNVSPQLFLYWLNRGYTNKHEICFYFGDEPKELHILNHSASKKKQPVILDGILYESIKKAAEAVGGNSSYLSKALKKNKPYKGLKCQYGNQQPSQRNTNNSTLEGSTTNE